MPAILSAYRQAVDALTPVMKRPAGAIVTIDGREGVGKTTLGRYLAWHFNVTLIETDLFLIPAQDYLIYLDDQINRIIERRASLRRPVIVEGVAILQMMKRIGRVADFAIYVSSTRRVVSPASERRVAAYEAEYAPSARADLVLTIER